MQNETNEQVHLLLDELTKESNFVRQKEIAELLEPYSDVAIPLLLERLSDLSDNYPITSDPNFYVRYNAMHVLAMSSHPRAVLPLIRCIEIKGGWKIPVFDHLRKGLREKGDNARQRVNAELIRYLEEGPKVPVPQPFSPSPKEKSFNDFVSTIMKMAGVTELNDEAKRLAEKAKHKWMQPGDTTEDEKRKSSKIQEIIVEVIKTLSEFDGLQDSRLEMLLPKYIREYGFDSLATQHALTALSKINPSLATEYLNKLATSTQSSRNAMTIRVVGRKLNSNDTPYEFTLCIREPDVENRQERTYHFIFEQGLVFLFARVRIVEKWFVGQASNQDNAITLATDYLGRWIRNIDSLNRILDRIKHRYAECIQVVQQFIDFEKWGFQQTRIWSVYEYSDERPQIIYDSEYCRVKVSFRSYGEMHDQSDVLSILYGRSHAADKEDSILWKGEPHHCWHDVSLALCFLDGMSPEDAAKILWNHPLMAEYKANLNSGSSQPAIEAGIHAVIWERYGQRLFQLFNLGRPDLWNEFSIFVKRVYEIKGFKHYGHGVPYEKIA